MCICSIFDCGHESSDRSSIGSETVYPCPWPGREEREKFNVWVAWLNLESMHGTPEPDQALMALFQRALQHCDQKKLYLALLGILERLSKVRQFRRAPHLTCVKCGGTQRY